MLPAAGVSTHDDFNAYYVGRFIDGDTSREVFLPDGEAAPSPGLLTFNFESSAISNTSDGGYQGDRSVNGQWTGPGAMLNVPTFGVEGILVMKGGAGMFNNITIFDKHAHSWLSQLNWYKVLSIKPRLNVGHLEPINSTKLQDKRFLARPDPTRYSVIPARTPRSEQTLNQ